MDDITYVKCLCVNVVCKFLCVRMYDYLQYSYFAHKSGTPPPCGSYIKTLDWITSGLQQVL